jgi:hypothetical protein
MVVDERARHELFGRLEDVLGAKHAVTLMEHMPPVGWADVATKHDLAVLKRDLDALEERLELRIDGVRQELGAQISAMRQEIVALFRAELSSALTAQTKTLMFTVLGALTSMTALVLAAGRV